MKKILVVDFGSQYTQLIARRLRELSVYSEVCPWDEIVLDHVEGFILSGGPESSNIEGNPNIDSLIFNTNKPILGICYGMQVLAHQEEGQIINEGKKFGYAKINIKADTVLFKNMSDSSDVWMSHSDKVESLPDGYVITATSDNSPIAAYENTSKIFWSAISSRSYTENGTAIIKNFLNICGIEQNWSSDDILQQIDAVVQQKLRMKVLLALSGGVDSTVLAAVLHRTLGNRLTCVMVDHGLLRKDEAQNVVTGLKEKIGLSVNLVNAQDIFLSRLEGVTDPEQKRKIIGNTFIEVFESESKKLNDTKWLAQGTIYPDVIESTGNSKDKSKSH